MNENEVTTVVAAVGKKITCTTMGYRHGEPGAVWGEPMNAGTSRGTCLGHCALAI